LGEDDKHTCFFSIITSIDSINAIKKFIEDGIDNELKTDIKDTDKPNNCKAFFQVKLRQQERELVQSFCKYHNTKFDEIKPHFVKRLWNPLENFVRKTFLIGIIIASTETIFLLYRYLLDIALHDKYNLLIQLTNINKVPESLTSETYLKIGFIIVGFSTLIGMIADYMHNKKK
jgi:hypothetical protein